MSQIQRPTKQGGATTYQGKVSAGYTTILASEMDADLDTIYSAWNTGVDGSNIQPGSITGAKLAPGAVGSRELADGGIQTIDIGDGQVTGAKIAQNTIGTGNIVNGQITTALLADDAVTAPKIAPNSVGTGHLIDGQITTAKIADDAITGPKIAPNSIGTGHIIDGQVSTAELADGAVTHAKLALGTPVSVQVPAGFVLSTSTWTTLVTLPSMTTKGGFVQLHANHCLSSTGPPGGGTCNQRWLRDGSPLVQWPFSVALVSSGQPQTVPFPGIHFVDTACPAGAHVYSYQVLAGVGCIITSLTTNDGMMQAVEIG